MLNIHRIVWAMVALVALTSVRPVYASELISQDKFFGPTKYFSVDQFVDHWSPGESGTEIAALPDQIFASVTPPSGSRVLHVGKNGSDSNKGESNSPWKTLSHAIASLQAGDTLVIDEGVYSENIVFNKSGTENAYITIRGEGNVTIDGSSIYAYTPIFDTNGQNYLKFENLTVKNSRAAVQVNKNSHHIAIDGLVTDKNHFAVYIKQGHDVSVKNAIATNSRNAFRAEGDSHNLHFENIETYGSKDVYDGMDLNYLNGDGFIFEDNVHDVMMRNIISADHWDAGFDLKGSNITVENVVAWGNKNNFKTWGNNILIRNSVSFNAKAQEKPDGSYVDGNGINVRQGMIRLSNMTFVDNDDHDVKMTHNATVYLENSIISRSDAGTILGVYGGNFTSKNNLWYNTAGSASDVEMGAGDLWANPLFKDRANGDFHLLAASAAINRGIVSSFTGAFDFDFNERIAGNGLDLGAYEFDGIPTNPNPNPGTDPNPNPNPGPNNPAAVFHGVTEGQSVSGVVRIQPNLQLNPDIRKVAYYLNGAKSTKAYDGPFLWGGPEGFDTRQLADGTYTLAGAYTTKQGDQEFTLRFTVNNSGSNPNPNTGTGPQPNPSAAMLGLESGQTVSGVLQVKPNLQLNDDVRKVAYYLNGTQAGKVYDRPFTWGGPNGFDTRTLSNGTYTLSGAYTTSQGDQVFAIQFTVFNGTVLL